MLNSLEEAFRFAAELEVALRRHANDKATLVRPRSEFAIIRYFKAFLGGDVVFRFKERDFQNPEGLPEELARRAPTVPALRSFILNAADTTGICRIFLNKPMMNNCWRRFCKVKEASQAVIRRRSLVEEGSIPERDDEWEIRIDTKEYICDDPEVRSPKSTSDFFQKYVDTIEPGKAARLLKLDAEREVTLADFDRYDLEIELRIEKLGEILAALLLFPPSRMIEARDTLLEERSRRMDVQSGSEEAILSGLDFADFYPIADLWKIPTKCVQSFLTLNSLDALCDAYSAVLRAHGQEP